MKKIPARYELTEEDIKIAIASWFNSHEGRLLKQGYKIEFRATQIPCMGNQSREIITAVLTESEE